MKTLGNIEYEVEENCGIYSVVIYKNGSKIILHIDDYYFTKKSLHLILDTLKKNENLYDNNDGDFSYECSETGLVIKFYLVNEYIEMKCDISLNHKDAINFMEDIIAYIK